MADLDFCEASHTYRVDDVVVPHVTQVLAPLEQWYGIPPSTLEYAAERGRAVHLATQLYEEDDLDYESLDDVVRPYLDAYMRFCNDARPEWHGVEERVYHEQYGYAGTLDRRGVLHGLKGAPEAVVDLKAVSVVSPATGVQTAAYDAAAPKTRKKRRRFALQLKPNGTYKLREFDEPSDWPIYVSLLNVAIWRQRHNFDPEQST